MAAEPSELVGQILVDRYRILSVLGKGGFSVVYRAEHVTLGRPLAIKVLPQGHELVEWLKPRFEREARILAALAHPNIVSVVDYGIAEMPFLVMELVEGQLLRDVIDRGPMPLSRTLHIARQLLQGLDYAHAQGVMHRDLKPSNVVITDLPDAPDHVKILDFGFGKWFGPGEKSGDTPLTEQGKTFGTPGYIAPERLHGEPAEGRADLYAVGVVIFEMLAGRKPFEGTPLEMMQAHMLALVPRLREARSELSELPSGLDAVLRRAMAKRPEDRYQNARTMLVALEDAAAGRTPAPAETAPQPVVARPPPLPNPSPPLAPVKAPGALAESRLRLALAAVAVLVLGGIGWTLVRMLREPTETPATAGPVAPDVEEATVELGNEIPVADPWAAGVPAELAPIRERLQAGDRLTRDELAPLFTYVRAHPTDARPQLLFGTAYMRLGYREASIQRYLRAYRQEPGSRGDPRMLRDLLVAAAEGPSHLQAARALQTIYGREALPSLERAIAALSSQPGAAANLVALRDEIRN